MNYYKEELNKVSPVTQYAPTLKVFANGNGKDTKHLSLNEESAQEIIYWLANNFLNDKSLAATLDQLKQLPYTY